MNLEVSVKQKQISSPVESAFAKLNTYQQQKDKLEKDQKETNDKREKAENNNIDIKTVLRIVICGHFKNSHAKVTSFSTNSAIKMFQKLFLMYLSSLTWHIFFNQNKSKR